MPDRLDSVCRIWCRRGSSTWCRRVPRAVSSCTTAQAGSKTPEKSGREAPKALSCRKLPITLSLIPFLAPGIPGEAFTAMKLTVFIVHGVDPGPTLFEEHQGFVSGLYLSLLIMNFIIVGVSLVATKWIARLSMINDRLSGMIIICLVMVGTFASNCRLTDTIIAIAFGILGLIAPLRLLDSTV